MSESDPQAIAGPEGSDDDSGKPSLIGKKKKKSDRPGYKMFEADPSDSEGVIYDDSNKAPVSKLKKHGKPSFKFANKIKLKEKDKPDKEKSEEKESGRTKKKDKLYKGHKKFKRKLKEKPALTVTPSSEEAASPVFGVPLGVAVERTPSHDGVLLPICVRECVDYIEEHGLLYEGIYRISGVKSKVQMLKECYNKRQMAHLFEHDPSIVASLLKLFLRELPEPALTSQLMPRFEEASVIMQHSERLSRLKACVNGLPPCNRELLSWMIVHMSHVIAKEKINKMSLQNVSIVLSPTMRISHRVLNVLFMHASELFPQVQIIRYRPPLQASASRWSVDMPEGEEAIADELRRQESLLNQLHTELSRQTSSTTTLTASTTTSEQEENLWEVQRNVTQLKRKLKLIAKTKAAKELEKKRLSSEDLRRSATELHRRSINAAELNFALQTGSLRKKAARHTASDTGSVASDVVPAGGSVGEPERLTENQLVERELDVDAAITTQTETENAEELKTPTSTEGRWPTTIETRAKESERNEVSGQVTSESVSTGAASLGVVKKSDSQESDVTLSPSSVCVSQSTSQQSFRAVETLSDSRTTSTDTETTATETIATPTDSLELSTVSQVTPPSRGDEEGIDVEEAVEGIVDEKLEPIQDDRIIPVDHCQQESPAGDLFSDPKALLAASPPGGADTEPSSSTFGEATEEEYDEELLKLLISQEAQLIWEEEELIAIKDELKQKIAAERLEIERLNEEIAEYEELRSITTLGHSSAEAVSSDEYYTSTSDTDPASEDDQYNELNSLVRKLKEITESNARCEGGNASLLRKIDEERMGCLNIKIQIRLLQQQALGAQMQQEYSLI